MTITLYHNPACGTSRNTLAMIRASGEEPVVVDYLQAGWSAERLQSLAAQMGAPIRSLIRDKGTPARALGLFDEEADDPTIIAAMIAHPVIVNRPIVVSDKGVRLCRPSELVLDLLSEPLARFAKEDGEDIGA